MHRIAEVNSRKLLFGARKNHQTGGIMFWVQ